MASVFRFSNAVSDIDKFIDTYKEIYNHFANANGSPLNHDDCSAFLANKGLATSLGAVGQQALNRSRRADKSRDPLYNQHKSYSEMFRMLGWYKPCAESRTEFMLTDLGSYIADNNPMFQYNIKKLVKLNILHIVSPNPYTTVKGGNLLRPIAFTLKLLLKLNCLITRDEIILGVLSCKNDKEDNIIDKTAQKLLDIRRKGKDELENQISNLMRINNLGSNETLGNYTRFPIAALKWMGYVETSKTKIYKNTSTLQMTDKGISVAKKIIDYPDIRYEDIKKYTEEEQKAFIAHSIITKLACAGYDTSILNYSPKNLEKIAKKIFDDYKIEEDKYLFFGFQEAPEPILKKADADYLI